MKICVINKKLMILVSIAVKMANVVLWEVPKVFPSLDGNRTESLIILNQLGAC